MNNKKNYIILIVTMIVSLSAYAQSTKQRLQPGKLYRAGQKIYAPKYGFTSAIPEGWEGTLPREMEIFLLMPDSIDVGGEIYTFANNQANLEEIRGNWINGAKLSESITIKAPDANAIKTEGDIIFSEVVGEGENINKGYRGFAAARCSPFGPCITCLGIGPKQFYTDIEKAVRSFMSESYFSGPTEVSPYVDFNWKEFLSGKMLISLLGVEGGNYSGTKENTFHLCKDGSFKGNIKKKGMMKEVNPQYKGNQSGTWTAEGVGEEGKLTLVFNDLPAVELALTIKDEKISVNGERYFAAESDGCGSGKKKKK